jgi:hypothetical protein
MFYKSFFSTFLFPDYEIRVFGCIFAGSPGRFYLPLICNFLKTKSVFYSLYFKFIKLL